MKQPDILDFARTRVVETPGEEFLGEKIKDYWQNHLAVPFKGSSYRREARKQMAQLAISRGCEFAVDGDFCQDNEKERSVILAATGLRNKKLPRGRVLQLDGSLDSIQLYAERNIAHISAAEFLARIEQDPGMYFMVDLKVSHAGGREDYVKQAELALVEEALRQKCAYVTNMDYTRHDTRKYIVEIEAKGLIEKP